MEHPTLQLRPCLGVRPDLFSYCFSPSQLNDCFHRKYMHGYITNQPYTPPNHADDPRDAASVYALSEVRTHGSENEKGSCVIDFAKLSEN
jgi:hypothetical protein